MSLPGVIETQSSAYNGDHTDLSKQSIDHLTTSHAQDVKQCWPRTNLEESIVN